MSGGEFGGSLWFLGVMAALGVLFAAGLGLCAAAGLHYLRGVLAQRKGAALVIERTHYDDTVLELISPVNLRRELKLEDGDELAAIIHLER